MRSTPTIRVLVADVSEQWRRYVRGIVISQQCFEVVTESSDGFDAIQKAFNLQPDVILLDSALPRFRGITVARAIRRLCPNAITILLAKNPEAKEMAAALACGSRYLAKAKAQTDLVEAIGAMLDGRAVGITRPAQFQISA